MNQEFVTNFCRNGYVLTRQKHRAPHPLTWCDFPPIRRPATDQRRAPVAQYLEADLAEFKKLQGVVKAYLEDNPDSGGNIM